MFIQSSHPDPVHLLTLIADSYVIFCMKLPCLSIDSQVIIE